MKHITTITMLTLLLSFQHTFCMNKKKWPNLTKYTKIAHVNEKIKKEKYIQEQRLKKYLNLHDFDDTKPTQNSFRYDINRELR